MTAAGARPEPRVRTALGWREFVALALALGALLLIVAGSIWVAERTGDALTTALRLERQRMLSRELLLDLTDAETGQRGYLLSGKDSYLAPYMAARDAYPALMAALESDTAGSDPAERSTIRQLRATAEAKLAELARTVTYGQNGEMDAAMALVQTDHGLELMTELRQLTGQIGRTQDTALRRQVKLVESRRHLLVVIESAGLLVLLATAGLIAAGLRSTLSTIRQAGQALARSNAQMAEANHTLDDQVRSRTADLQDANEEIQRFAYIVSHDLRAPLVNIMGFTSELEQAAATIRRDAGVRQAPPDVIEAMDVDIPEAIGFIKASSGKMDRLINAILRLSREGRRVAVLEALDMTLLCRDIAATLRTQTADKGAQLDIGMLPPLVADRVMVEQVFTNVIDNALKYLVPGRPGHVSVSGGMEHAMARFDIADNGRGIAERDYERVFELFRRAGDQTVAGEGIGLAHVRALVRRLGGGIVCKSELGVGTTFTIHLPAAVRPPGEPGVEVARDKTRSVAA